jgi:hypothetical protein
MDFRLRGNDRLNQDLLKVFVFYPFGNSREGGIPFSG